MAQDPALVVILGVRRGGQPSAYVLDAAAGGRGEPLDGDGVSVDEQPQQRDQQARVEAGLVGVGESVGQGGEG